MTKYISLNAFLRLSFSKELHKLRSVDDFSKWFRVIKKSLSNRGCLWSGRLPLSASYDTSSPWLDMDVIVTEGTFFPNGLAAVNFSNSAKKPIFTFAS